MLCSFRLGCHAPPPSSSRTAGGPFQIMTWPRHGAPCVIRAVHAACRKGFYETCSGYRLIWGLVLTVFLVGRPVVARLGYVTDSPDPEISEWIPAPSLNVSPPVRKAVTTPGEVKCLDAVGPLVLRLANAERLRHGAPELKEDQVLDRVATDHSTDMLVKGYSRSSGSGRPIPGRSCVPGSSPTDRTDRGKYRNDFRNHAFG